MTNIGQLEDIRGMIGDYVHGDADVRQKVCTDMCIDMCTDMCSARATHRWKALVEAVILSTGTSIPVQ